MIDRIPRRLLAVDDDEAVCFTICAIAEKAGFETRAAITHGDFLALLSEWNPTHVIVDLRMPDVDGIEVLHYLSQREGNEAVIITSGLGSRILEAAARAASENGLRVGGILPKPFTSAKLRALLIGVQHGDDGRKTTHPEVKPSTPFEVTEETLAEALAARSFQVCYQPKIDCATRALSGFEGLVRWPHSELGMIMPDRFIPLAEQTGLIAGLTGQVFEQGLAWFADHFRGAAVRIALNVSAKVLADPGFPDSIVRHCARVDLPPRQVILEITETSTMQNPVAMLEILTQFRIKGFSLSIDDFGVGYSSLVQLARLPFSELKIDKMFIVSARTSSESQTIASAIVGLAHALGLHATAEGVEDEWTLNFLREIGCDSAQGYHIARPMDGTAAGAWRPADNPTGP